MDKFVGPAASRAEKYTPTVSVDPLTGHPISSAALDSNGEVLPAGFDNYPTVVDNSTEGVTVITTTTPSGVYVQTIPTVDGVTTFPAPVKQ